MRQALINNGRGLAIASLKVLDVGLDVFVPLGMLLIGVLQLFPDLRIESSPIESVVDISGGAIFILPLCLFTLSLAVKLFRTAQFFPINHWGFLVGLGAAINSILLVTIIIVTERIDAFWVVLPLLVAWLVLRFISSVSVGFLARLKESLYGLFVTGLLLLALLFPIFFGIKYELTSIVGSRLESKIESLEFPENDHCFRTIVTAYANTLGYGFIANEEFDKDCAAIDTANVLIESGLKNNDIPVAATGIEALTILSPSYKAAAVRLKELLLNAMDDNGKACFEDEKYIFCVKQ
jgi:hypothetical protein